MRVDQIKKCLSSYEGTENTQKMEETIAECRRITRENAVASRPRSSFLDFLSEVLRMNGKIILGGQMVTLVIICLIIQMVSDYPKLIPVFIPFFILAALPVLFRAEINHMSEIELATRNSYAQLLLARLIIIGAADIICFTLLLAVEICCFRSGLGLLNLILYVFVPYMLCVTAMLRMIRSGKGKIISSAMVALTASFLWGITAFAIPGLYVGSAVGVWMICFIVFGVFFIREMEYLISYVKEGKIYGFVA